MSSKASAPRRSGRAKQFVKDWMRLARSGRYPMQELKDVMQFLIENRGPLPPEGALPGEVPFAVNREIPNFTARPPPAGHVSSFFSSVRRLYDSYF